MYGVLIEEDCGAQFPHESHSWREGFLWHRKYKCGGHTEDTLAKRFQRLMNPHIRTLPASFTWEHKHYYKLKWADPKTLMFECWGCKHQLRMDRVHLYCQMTNPQYTAVYFHYKLDHWL